MPPGPVSLCQEGWGLLTPGQFEALLHQLGYCPQLASHGIEPTEPLQHGEELRSLPHLLA